jgi:hypothetical protein
MRPKADFYARLPAVESFTRLADPDVYASLPTGWVVGLSDVVESTRAIEAGRYKAVNMAGASLIAAVANALGAATEFPFSFGGDGASFAVPSNHEGLARSALAATGAWVRDELGLKLRTALVPVDAARDAGFDVKVARFSPSRGVSYAMFVGGGLAFAEAQMRTGAYTVAAAPEGTRPDLSGLSCRFAEIKSHRGVILSLIVVPASAANDSTEFRALTESILTLAEGGVEIGHPVPTNAPPMRWPPQGLELEARARRRPGRPLLASQIDVGVRTLLAYAVFKLGLRVGAFEPARYLREVVENTDFRKFDDGLRMTLDCAPALADRIEDRLASARAQGVARVGTFRQEAALMTCFVPSATRSDHVHFVDGAMGGYAMAARDLKRQH